MSGNGRIAEVAATPNSLKLKLRQWIVVNNGIQAFGNHNISLPFTVAWRFGVLQKRIMPVLEEFEKQRVKVLESQGIRGKDKLEPEEADKLMAVLDPLLDEEFEERFTKVNPTDLANIQVPPSLVGMITELFIEEP